MENSPQEKASVFAKQTFDPDLKPLYALTEPQYQTIINQLSNLVMAVIEQYKGTEQKDLAQQTAIQAHEILQDYDDDVAAKIKLAGQLQEGCGTATLLTIEKSVELDTPERVV